MSMSSDLKKFISLSVIVSAPILGTFLVLTEHSSEDTVADYTDVMSSVMLLIATVLLALVIPKVSDRFFRTTTILLALGVGFQFIYSLIWYYYWHIVSWGRMPNYSIGDFFYLGSYVLWASATVPYLRRYGSFMTARSHIALGIYSVIAAVVIYVSADYWYGAALSYGYDWPSTYVWLSYAIVPSVLLVLPLATTLLYALEGYGRGLFRFYWLYFLVPIYMVVIADLLNGFYYVLYEGSLPGQLDDLTYLAAYCVFAVSGYVVYSSKLAEASYVPVVESHQLEGQKVELVKGRGHIVEDPEGSLSYSLLEGLVTGKTGGDPRPGYIVTRHSPDHLAEKLDLRNVRVTWMSTAPREGAIEPSKIGLIAQSVMEFLQTNRNGVVLFDGIESVMLYNDFNRTVRMLGQINDFVMQYQGYLLVPIDPKAFDPKELAVLERDFERVSRGAG